MCEKSCMGFRTTPIYIYISKIDTEDNEMDGLCSLCSFFCTPKTENCSYLPPGFTRHHTMLLLPLCTDFFSTIFCRESEKGTSRVETSLEFLSRVTLKGAARYCLRQTPIDFQRQKDFTSSESVCYVWLLNVCSDGTCHSRCQKA